MQKEITINIGGQAFTIEEDAYQRLQEYLNEVDAEIKGTAEEKKEMIDDIEIRISELLIEIKGGKSPSVKLEHVIRVISIMGSPKDFESASEGEGNTYSQNTSNTTYEKYDDYEDLSSGTYKKRLYRNKSRSIFGGVCSGMGDHLNIDAVILRILFIVLFFAGLSGLLIYVILWIIIPKNNDNISSPKGGTKKRHYNAPPPSYQQREGESNWKNVLVVVFVFIGVLLIVKGIKHNNFFSPFHWNFNFPFWKFAFRPFHNMDFGDFCIFLLIAIPILGLLIWMVRAISGNRKKKSSVAPVLTTVWVLALLGYLSVGLKNSDWKFVHTEKHTVRIDADMYETFFVEAYKHYDRSDFEHYTVANKDYLWSDDYNRLFIQPKLNIEYREGDAMKVEVKKKYWSVGGRRNVFSRNYNCEVNDSLLLLDVLYPVQKNKAFRAPEVSVNFQIPFNKDVVFSEEFDEVIQ